MARFRAEVLVSVSVEVEYGDEPAARGVIADWLCRFREGSAAGIGRYFVRGWSSEIREMRREKEE